MKFSWQSAGFFVHRLLTAALMIAVGCQRQGKHADTATVDPHLPEIIARSRVSNGNPARLLRVMARARKGERITIGYIGGSITRGEKATPLDQGYAGLVTQWWRARFPKSNINEINAGVSGTGSNYGCLRVEGDLIAHQPDFVVVEFGVNDRDEQAATDTYEGVVRQLMLAPKSPAVLLLFMMHHIGTNAQAGESDVGKWYGLPMISYRDAYWPEITAGHLKLGDLFFDTVHPNNRGHAAVAGLITAFLEDTYRQSLATASLPEIPPIPKASRFTSQFAQPLFLRGATMPMAENKGWTFDRISGFWSADQVGSECKIHLRGRQLCIVVNRSPELSGKIVATVDGKSETTISCYFDSNWSYPDTVPVADHFETDEVHTVSLKLEGTTPTSQPTDPRFEFLGIGSTQ